jgi:hypothetical protein
MFDNPPPMADPPPKDDRLRALLSEVSTALAWLGLARQSQGEDARLCTSNLQRCYETVLQLIAKTPMTPTQESDIWRRLGPVQDWLNFRR